MAARRLILAMVVLLVASSVAAALVPVEREATESTPSTPTEAQEPQPTGELVERTLRTGAKQPRQIVIALGDQLALRVKSRVAAEIEIPALGELANVDRDSPAEFDLLPFEPGTYIVRVAGSRKPLGRIVVRPGDQSEPSETDSPGDSTQARTPGARRAS